MLGKQTHLTIPIFFFSLFLLMFSVPFATAQTLSAGCTTVDGGTDVTDGAFLAGETISLTITIPDGQARIDLFVNSILVDSTGFFPGPGSGTVSYTFQQDQTADVAWTTFDLGVTPGGLVTTTSCAYTGLPGEITALQAPPDDRINWRAGDDLSILYSRPDDFGNPALDVYCYFDGVGIWQYRLTQAELDAWDDSLPQEVPVATVPQCNTSIYELDTGQIQINITLDAAKYYEIICEDLNCSVRTIRFSDPSLWRQ